MRLCRITQQLFHLSWTVILWVNSDNNFTSGGVLSNLSVTFALPLDIDIDMLESLLDKLTHGMHLTSGQDKIIWLLSLQHQPHSLDIVSGMTPISHRIQITQVQTILFAQRDGCHSATNLSSHKGLTSARRFMIEKDTVAGKHTIRLAIVDYNPVSVHLGNTIRGARIERSSLLLRNFLHFTVQLTSGCLIELHLLSQTASTNSIQQAQRSQSINLASVLGHVKRHLHMRLSGQVVNLSRSHLRDDVHETGGVSQITIVQNHLWLVVLISVQMLNTASVE